MLCSRRVVAGVRRARAGSCCEAEHGGPRGFIPGPADPRRAAGSAVQPRRQHAGAGPQPRRHPGWQEPRPRAADPCAGPGRLPGVLQCRRKCRRDCCAVRACARLTCSPVDTLHTVAVRCTAGGAWPGTPRGCEWLAFGDSCHMPDARCHRC